MKKTLTLIALIAFAAGAALSAQEAVFSEVNGKVEYQLTGGSWTPAKVGDKIGKGTMVSTGFKSGASLKLGVTVITLKPVTRMTLDQIVQSQSGSKTELYLLAGRVKADVPPQAGQTSDFRVKSPTATASVRGTGFEFDGINLIVNKGNVELRAPTGQYRYVKAGEFSYMARGGQVSVPAAVTLERGLDRVDQLVDQAQAESLTTTVTANYTAPTITANVTVVIQ